MGEGRQLWMQEQVTGGPGVKSDVGKPRMDLIAPSALFALGRVLEIGARKYSDRNWEAGMPFGRPFAAIMRHLWAWWNGEDRDPESGLSHLDHALCELMFLVEFEDRLNRYGKQEKYIQDDRPMPAGRLHV